MKSWHFDRLEKNFLQYLSRRGRSTNTLKNYRTDLECFRRYLEENNCSLNLSTLKPKYVQHYGSYIEKAYKSDNSRRRRVQALRIFFDYLVEKKVYHGNVVRSLPTSPKFIDIPRPPLPRDVGRLWKFLLRDCQTSEDLKNAMAWRNAVLFLLIYGGGLKVGQLAGLERRQVRSSASSSRVLLTPTKGNPYTVPLPNIFHPIFSRYKQSLKPFKKPAFKQLLFNANIYAIISGGLGARGIEVIFEHWRNCLNIDSLTPKSLRQACILSWLGQKIPPVTIKNWLNLSPSYDLGPYTDSFREHGGYRKDILKKNAL